MRTSNGNENGTDLLDDYIFKPAARQTIKLIDRFFPKASEGQGDFIAFMVLMIFVVALGYGVKVALLAGGLINE